MKLHRLWLRTTLIAMFWAADVLAQAKPEQLGRAHFPVSCGVATQTQFDRAIALLHSFWYSEGVKAFTAVTEADPSCAMGYWGIAMSHWYPLWQPPSEAMLKKGGEAVERAKALGGKTEREREYIAAIEVFYTDVQKLDHRTRALAYEKAMERLYARYPEDREAAVFYALALNATILPTDKTYANQLKAAEILEQVFAAQPDHPGVAHYLIHSYDYPTLASRGLDAARRYAKIAPSAPHALHMPSHVFTRLGLWQESIASNRDSAAASKEHHSVFEQLHALDYQAYGYLQGAQDREARRILDECQALAKEDLEHFASAYAFAAIPARYALERRQWAEAAALEPRPSRVKYSEAITYFARALGAARSGDAASTRANVNKLQALPTALVDTKQDYWAGQVEIQHRTAAAWLARAEGKPEEAVRLMREATTLEDATEKHPVTPGPIFPARELLGELLLELQQPAQALQEFEASMPKEPNRFNGLYGAARAAELTGEVEKARTYYGQLVALSERGDTDRPALQQAKAFLAKK
jgi:tetratricopeptide (TPR) repeat protein